MMEAYACIKAKAKEFNGAVNTNVLDNEVPKMKYLEECKYKIQEKTMPGFIGQCTFNQKLTSILMKLIKINTENFS